MATALPAITHPATTAANFNFVVRMRGLHSSPLGLIPSYFDAFRCYAKNIWRNLSRLVAVMLR